MRTTGLGGLLIVTAAFLVTGIATADDDSLDRYIELLRADARASKVGILTEALDLTQGQADLFWPIQREYENELSALGDRRLALINEFASVYGTMTDEQAATLSATWFKLHDDRVKLRKKYYKKMGKALGSLIAARFIQIENAIGLLIDVNMASEIPLLE
jgi:hypothetical protein